MIKVISFDIGGTLAKQEKDNYSLKALAILLNKDYDVVRNAYKNVFQKSNGSFNELLDKFTKILNIDKSKELIDFLNNKFSIKQEEITKDKIELITKLKEMNYKIILFSNTSNLYNNKLPEDLLKIVDDIFYSYEIGYTKNENESYKIVEKKLNNKSNEFLHIGDTLKSDYYAPINNGWNALYYGYSEDENINAIHSLDEIFNYLEKNKIKTK